MAHTESTMVGLGTPAADFQLPDVVSGRPVQLADFAARGWLQISARAVLIVDSERLRKRAR